MITFPDETYDITLDEDETFSWAEAEAVKRDYVCAVCHLELSIMFSNAHNRVLVVCQSHGTVTKCGRVMRSTVSIEYERAVRKFSTVIRNLPDLWGELIPPRETREQMIKILGF
jgi:hypothetical protein